VKHFKEQALKCPSFILIWRCSNQGIAGGDQGYIQAIKRWFHIQPNTNRLETCGDYFALKKMMWCHYNGGIYSVW